VLRAHVTQYVKRTMEYRFDNIAFNIVLRNRENLARKCNQVISELMETEEKYCRYLQDIRAARKEMDAVITPEESSALFSCIKEIAKANTHLLRELMVLDENSGRTVIVVIGDAFKFFVKTTLHQYGRYCGNIVWATETLSRLKLAKKGRFVAIHDRYKKQWGKGLDNLIMEPMQRITRYPIIFERLMYFLIEPTDRKLLKQVLKQARRAVGQVNVDIEQWRRLYDLEKCMGKRSLAQFGLIQREDKLFYASYKGSNATYRDRDATQVTAFVFKAAVLVTKRDKRGNHAFVNLFELKKGEWHLTDIEVAPGSGSVHAWGLAVQNGSGRVDVTHVVASPSQDTKYNWMTMQDDGISLPMDEVTVGNLFGYGTICNVHEGKLSNVKSVAIKMAQNPGDGYEHLGAQTAAELQRGSLLSETAMDVASRALEEEAMAMQSLPLHPNFVRFYGLCASSTVQSKWLVMELMINGSLDEFLNGTTAHGAGMQLEFDKLIVVFTQITTGLGALHDKKIVHRNLQASNILIGGVDEQTQTSVVKISSFRLAVTLSEINHNYAAPNDTPDTPLFWRAPESQRRALYSVATDIWSVGVLFAEALLLWSPSSYGETEIYHGLSDAHVTEVLERQQHMETPPGPFSSLLPRPTCECASSVSYTRTPVLQQASCNYRPSIDTRHAHNLVLQVSAGKRWLCGRLWSTSAGLPLALPVAVPDSCSKRWGTWFLWALITRHAAWQARLTHAQWRWVARPRPCHRHDAF